MSLVTWLLLVLVPDPAVDTWIDRLADNDFRTRNHASQQLEQTGVRALRRLRLAADDRNPERAQRAQRLVEKYYGWIPYPTDCPPIYNLVGRPMQLLEWDTAAGQWVLMKSPPEPPILAELRDGPVLGLVCHYYYSRALRQADLREWNWFRDVECMAMHMLLTDAADWGVSRELGERLLAALWGRSNPVPTGMPAPPKWLKAWAIQER